MIMDHCDRAQVELKLVSNQCVHTYMHMRFHSSYIYVFSMHCLQLMKDVPSHRKKLLRFWLVFTKPRVVFRQKCEQVPVVGFHGVMYQWWASMV